MKFLSTIHIFGMFIESFIERTIMDTKQPIQFVHTAFTPENGKGIDWTFPYSAVEVIPGLWLGSATHAADKQFRKDNGITHIVNVADDIVPEQGTGMTTLWIPGQDTRTYPMLEKHFEDCAQFIDRVLLPCPGAGVGAGASKGKVLVHCRAGMNRSALIALAYAIDRHCFRHGREDPVVLIRRVYVARPVIMHNIWFRVLLAQFIWARVGVTLTLPPILTEAEPTK